MFIDLLIYMIYITWPLANQAAHNKPAYPSFMQAIAGYIKIDFPLAILLKEQYHNQPACLPLIHEGYIKIDFPLAILKKDQYHNKCVRKFFIKD